MFMTNGDFVLVRADVCRKCLQDFFDSLVENGCSDPKLLSLVNGSIVNMVNVLNHVHSLKVSCSR